MADTAVTITQGTGTNIDTRTEATNGNHRQVIVIGDPSTNAGVAPVDATNGLAVDVKQSALPSGAATSSKQDTGNTSLATIATAVSGTLATSASITDGVDTALVTAAGELNVLATAQPGVDVGDVTINNAAGASAVNIQDGGNSITVDGTVTANISGSISNTSFASTIADGADATLGAKADAKSTATDTTAVTAMQVLKEISYMEQNPASRAVTNTGTFAVQATLQTQTDTVMVGGVNIKEINAVTPLMGNGVTGTGSQRVTIASDNTPFPVKTDQTTHGTTDLVAADITKIGGNTVSAGNGASGTGVQRVTVANDSTGILAGVTTVTTLTNQSQEGGVNISLNAGAVDTGTRRVVQANGAGKTILSKSGSASSSGNNTLVAAGTNKLKVFAFSLSTTSTTAMTCKFQDGASGTDLWSVILQAGTSVSTGANLTVSPPAWLFNTSAATLLNLNLSSANAVQWSVSYFDEA